jgi:DNA polymerase-4
VGVSGLSEFVQDDLFARSTAEEEREPREDPTAGATGAAVIPPVRTVWRAGQDVVHAEHGAGWVWGSGRSLVTVRFEGPLTTPGPVRTFADTDPALTPGPPPDWF